MAVLEKGPKSNDTQKGVKTPTQKCQILLESSSWLPRQSWQLHLYLKALSALNWHIFGWPKQYQIAAPSTWISICSSLSRQRQKGQRSLAVYDAGISREITCKIRLLMKCQVHGILRSYSYGLTHLILMRLVDHQWLLEQISRDWTCSRQCQMAGFGWQAVKQSQ